MAAPDAHTPPNPFPTELAVLGVTFAAHEDVYTAPQLEVAEVRQQFLAPLYATLGRDVGSREDLESGIPFADR